MTVKLNRCILYGPDIYVDLNRKIEQDRLRKLNMAETVSLTYQMLNSNDVHKNEEIEEIMRTHRLLAFTMAMYVPKKGVYLQDLSEFRGDTLSMNESELIRKLESGDPSVRFTPFGFKVGSQSSVELARNPFIIDLAGEEGAEKLGEMSGKYGIEPYLWSFESVNEPLIRVSALSSGFGFDFKLFIYASCRGDTSTGYAFGAY